MWYAAVYGGVCVMFIIPKASVGLLYLFFKKMIRKRGRIVVSGWKIILISQQFRQRSWFRKVRIRFWYNDGFYKKDAGI